MKIGLFFGSFNPIHLGHSRVIQHFLSLNLFDRIWIIVSPQNPLKENSDLIPPHHRLNMVHTALKDMDRTVVCDIEFRRSQPSYTFDTLRFLRRKHPTYRFDLIVGGDVSASLHQWKNASEITDHHHIHIYPRNGIKHHNLPSEVTTRHIAKEIEMSASLVRSASQKTKPKIDKLLHKEVWKYGQDHQLF